MAFMIDPTTLNAQGPEDIGTQYRSAIFYHTDEQKSIAEKVTKEVQEKHYPETKIVTEISSAAKFYDAEEYHQFYLEKNPEGYAVSILLFFLQRMKKNPPTKPRNINHSYFSLSAPHITFVGRKKTKQNKTQKLVIYLNIYIFIPFHFHFVS